MKLISFEGNGDEISALSGGQESNRVALSSEFGFVTIDMSQIDRVISWLEGWRKEKEDENTTVQNGK